DSWCKVCGRRLVAVNHGEHRGKPLVETGVNDLLIGNGFVEHVHFGRFDDRFAEWHDWLRNNKFNLLAEKVNQIDDTALEVDFAGGNDDVFASFLDFHVHT